VKIINYISIVVVVVMLISSAVAMFFVGGYTSKTISIIFIAMAVSSVTRGIYQLFVKGKEKDERNIDIENKAKARAFDVMGIVFGILIIIYGFLKADLLIISLAGVAYLLIFAVYEAYFTKYHKEM